ncbi:MAG: RodZ domain-containing protein [Cyanobacteria bacterium P01_D01_bin.73]
MTQDSPNTDASPQDPLAAIGAELRQTREQKNISLESLAAQTKIQRRILVAIESGDWSALPEPVYIRGFISRIANALGLNGRDLAAKIPMAAVVQTPERPTSDFKPTAQLRPSHLYGIYIVLIVAAVWGLSFVLQRSGQQRSPVPVSDAPPTVSPSPEESPSPSPKPVPTPTPEASDPPSSPEPSPENTPEAEASALPDPISEEPDSEEVGSSASENSSSEDDNPTEEADASTGEQSEEEPSLEAEGWMGALTFPDSETLFIGTKAVNVNVQLTSRAWIRVVVDGQVDFEGVLPEGTERSWAADETLLVRSGNAGAVLLSFNGQNPEPLGEDGAVQEAQFDAEN